MRGILEGGERIAWGAKVIPEGGFWSMPKLTAPGMVLCGDTVGMVNVPNHKGIHYAIHSGTYAAETIFEQLKNESADFSAYEERVKASVIGRELYAARNMRQSFERGFFAGGAIANLMVATGGTFPGGRWPNHPDVNAEMVMGGRDASYPQPDGKYLDVRTLRRQPQREPPVPGRPLSKRPLGKRPAALCDHRLQVAA
ncbi:MAG: hypothetical protein M0Z66_16580 [Thermaerobacter sp.]|nr:hypothetical protein [Thermaerobacter sp.]